MARISFAATAQIARERGKTLDEAAEARHHTMNGVDRRGRHMYDEARFHAALTGVIGTARRVTTDEARQHFAAGGRVLVSEHGHEHELAVTRATTTHADTSTTWERLTYLVDTWRNRHPNQAFYVVDLFAVAAAR